MSQPFQNAPGSSYAGGMYGGPFYPPQSPYGQGQSYSPSPFAHLNNPPPSAFQPAATGLNVGNFNTNSQGPSPSFPFSTTSFPPEMLKQFANASMPLPPPGFPPMPLPNLNFPPFPPPLSTPIHHGSYSPAQQAASDEGSDAYDPRFPQGIPQNARPPAIIKSGSVQGQSYQEYNSAQNLPHTDFTEAYQNQAESSREPPSLDGTFFSAQRHPYPQYNPADAVQSRSTMPNTIPKQNEDSPKESIPVLAVLPDHESRPEVASSKADPEFGTSTQAKQAEVSYGNMSAHELRELAKGALKSFGPHKITFDDLVKEGINPELLTVLYKEAGISLPTNGTVNSDGRTSSLTVNESATEAQPPPAAPAVGAGLERKDRIAQLLAAKAGKPVIARTAPQSSPSTAPRQPPHPVGSNSNSPASFTPVVASVNGLRPVDVPSAIPPPQGPITASPFSAAVTAAEAEPRSAVDKQPIFRSMLPGLGMMSGDFDTDSTHTPAKRDPPEDGGQYGSNKRRNTGLSSTDDVDMDIGQSSSDASEGEVSDNPTPIQPQTISKQNHVDSPLDQRPKLSPSQPKPFSPMSGTKLTPAQIAEKARQLKAQFLEKRAKQQAEKDTASASDAEVAAHDQALASQRTELTKIRDRIKALEIDMQNAKTQEQDQLSQIERSEALLQLTVTSREKAIEAVQEPSVQAPSTVQGLNHSPTPAAADVLPAPQENNLIATSFEASTAVEASPGVSVAESEDPASAQLQQEDQPEVDLERSSAEVATDDAGEVVDEQTSQTSDLMEQSPEIDMLDIDDPQTEPEPGADEDHASEAAPQEQVYDDGNSDGSASMLDSASDGSQEEGEYSPQEDDATQPMELDGDSSDEYDPTDAPIDVAHKTLPSQIEHQHSPGETNADPSLDELAAVSDGLISAPTEVADGSDGHTSREQRINPFNTGRERAYNSDFGRRSYRNSAPATPNGRWNQRRPAVQPLANLETRSTSFSAYESPFTAFPSYRYNQNFSEASKDGFRSLTYSNSIDPKVPLCPTELSGVQCQDPRCEEQHFRHLELSDEKILTQMSSAQDFTDKETRDRYLLGLKAVIADLRNRSVREFEAVAQALSEHRRNFVAKEE